MLQSVTRYLISIASPRRGSHQLLPLDYRHPPHPADRLDDLAGAIINATAVFLGAGSVLFAFVMGWL